jgi:hypothetical protein
MFGLRKQIKRLDIANLVAGFEQQLQVAHLGRGVARNINDGLRTKRHELAEE